MGFALVAFFLACHIGFALAMPIDASDMEKGNFTKLEHTALNLTQPTPKPKKSSATQSVSSGLRVRYYMNVKITHYCPCRKCNGNTLRRGAWGAYLQDGMVASKTLPRGTRVGINGRIYRVEDKCARSGVIDIFVSKSHAAAYNMGSYRARVAVYY